MSWYYESFFFIFNFKEMTLDSDKTVLLTDCKLPL